MTSFHDAPLTNNYKQFMCRAELMIEMVTGLRYENAPTTSGRTVHETGLPVYHEKYQICALTHNNNWIWCVVRLACCLSKGGIRLGGYL
jgi:hypothetical protein